MLIRPIDGSELETACRWLADQQADPARHVAYLAAEPDAIAIGLRELEPDGLKDVLVALDGAELVGFLAAEHDEAPPRVWWHGPFVDPARDFRTVAGALHAAAEARLPAHVVQQEFALDERNTVVPEFATSLGFEPEEASAVLIRSLGTDSDPDRGLAGRVPAGVDIVPAVPALASQVARLHDELFPGTHRVGADLAVAGGSEAVLVACRGAAVVGYVAVQREADGSGYVDYLGVAPGARAGGIGRALVAAGCARLRDGLGCSRAHLTVRESNLGARRIYERLGFHEERVVRPWRRGFTLAD